MKLPFANGAVTLASGRTTDYQCSSINVSLVDYNANPAKHTIELTGNNVRGRQIKGDITLPVADVPALIELLQDYYGQHQRKHVVTVEAQ